MSGSSLLIPLRMGDERVLIRKLYRGLLTLYPRAFRERLEESMVQTFHDLLREQQRQGTGEVGFLIRTFGETSASIIREQANNFLETSMTHPNRATLISILLFLPFLMLNYLAGQDNKAIDYLFRNVFSLNGFNTNPLGHLVFLAAILLIPLGSVVAMRPLFKSDSLGKRSFHIVNFLVGTLSLLLFVLIAGALVQEVYRCDVLLIANCD